MYNPLQSMNAFAAGAQMGGGLRDAQTQNAFGKMIKDKDYEGARDYAYGRGNMELGATADGFIQQMGEQEKAQAAARAETLARSAITLQGIQNPMQRDDAYTRMIPDLLKAGIPEEQLRTFDPKNDAALQGVIDQVTPLADLLKGQAPAKFGNQLHEVIGPDGNPTFVRTDDQGGVHQVDGYSPAAKPVDEWVDIPTPQGEEGVWQENKRNGAKKRVGGGGVTFNNNPTPEQYADSLLTPPQTRGKDAAIVWKPDGTISVSPNAQQQGLNKAALKFNDLAAKNALVSDDINRALNHFTVVDPETGVRSVNPDQKSVGAWAATAQIPVFGGSTEAGTMESFLTTLRANVGFDELQAMREASPTGGALGQVSEREIAFLQALLGDLEQSRNPEILMYNLERLDRFLAGRQERFRQAFEADYPALSESVQREQAARSAVDDLLNMYAPEGGN